MSDRFKRYKFWQSAHFQTRQFSYGLALLALAGLLLGGRQLDILIEDNLQQGVREEFTMRVNAYGSALTQSVNRRLALISGVSSFVTTELMHSNTPGQEELSLFAAGLYENTAGILNIAVAPDGVVQFVYPHEENKSVLGYEPAQDQRPQVRADVQRAIDTRQIIISQPLELIQGGQGVIARQAIFIDDVYWGLSNIVVAVTPMLEDAGLLAAQDTIDLALKDQAGQIFYGAEDVFSSDAVTSTIYLLEGAWEMAGIPMDGWRASYLPILWIYRSVGLILVGLLTLLAYQYTRRHDYLKLLIARRTHDLQETKTQYRELVNNSLVGIYIVQDHIIQFGNQGLANLFGYASPENMVGMHIQELIAPASWEEVDLEVRQRESGQKKSSRYQFQGLRQDGSLIEIEALGTSIVYHGQPAVQGVLIDISERIRVEQRFRGLSEAAFEAIFISEKGICLEQNLAAEKMFGYTLAESVGRPGTDWIIPEDREIVMQNMLAGFEEPYQVTALRKDGSTFPCEIQGKMMAYQGRSTRVTALRNISKRVKSQTKLAETHQLMTTIFENTAILVAYLDPQFNFVQVNQTYAQADGLQPDFYPGKNHFDLYPNEENRAIFQQVVTSGEAHHHIAKPFEYAHNPERGISYWDWSLEPVKDSGGSVTGLILTLLNVSERIQAEQAMRESEQRYRLLFERSLAPIYRTTLDGQVLDANEAFINLMGYEQLSEIQALNAADFYFSPADREAFITALKEHGSLQKLELCLRNKDGHPVWILEEVNLVEETGADQHILGTAIDITERVQAEQALQQTNQLLEQERNMFIAGAVVTFKWQNKEGWPVEYVSPNVHEIFGYTAEQFTSGEIAYIHIILPGDIERVADEVTMGGESGEERFVHEPYRIERKDGKIIWIADYTTILRDQSGNITHYMGYVIDITERIQAEQSLRKYARQLETLNTVTAALSTSLALDEVLKIILDQIQKVIPNDSAAIFLLEDSNKLKIVSANGTATKFLGETFSLENTLMQGQEKLAQPIILDNAQEDPRFHNWAGAGTIRGWMGIPLVVREGLIGYLTLDSLRPNAFSAEQAALARPFAAQAAQAIDNARLHERVIADTNEMEKRVHARTEELQNFVNLTAGREIRMAELKQVIRKLRAQLKAAGIEPAADDPLGKYNRDLSQD